MDETHPAQESMEMIRSFVSIGIPEMPAVQDFLERLREIGGIGVSQNVHLTLRFLGDVETDRIKKLSAQMRSLEKYSSFNVSVSGLGAFPSNRDPRIVWMGAELGDQFYNILSDLDGMLDASAVDYERKPFKAHITLGRVKRPSTHLRDLLNEYRNLEAGSFCCKQIFLMKSLLMSAGAKHSVIDTFRLSDG